MLGGTETLVIIFLVDFLKSAIHGGSGKDVASWRQRKGETSHHGGSRRNLRCVKAAERTSRIKEARRPQDRPIRCIEFKTLRTFVGVKGAGYNVDNVDNVDRRAAKKATVSKAIIANVSEVPGPRTKRCIPPSES